jgi:hypothetical protein
MIEKLADKDNGKLTPDGRVTLGLAYDVQGYNPDEDSRIFAMARAKNVTPITAHYPGGPHAPRHDKVIKRWSDAGLLGSDIVMSHCTGIKHLHESDAELEWTLLKQNDVGVSATPVRHVSISIPFAGGLTRTAHRRMSWVWGTVTR